MILRRGNMFTDGEPDVILATCNSFIRKDGRVVMGRGAAKTMTQVFPRCDQTFGECIDDCRDARFKASGDIKLVYPLYPTPYPAYGVVYYESDGLTIGLFQVKDHWVNKATLELIASSVDILRKLTKTEWKDKAISLNFPGIGNGGLSRSSVLPLLHRLPDNVTIWEL